MKITDRALERLSELIALDNAPLDLVLENRYQVLARIARGGMGEIFRARDLRLRRDVAIKILSAELSTPSWIERFRSEAMTMTSIDHPGVVPIHDLAHLPDGRAWYAMKYIEGRTFDRVIAEKGDRRDLVRTLVQVCAVVQHAHDRSIIHRDLKPQNIMVGDNEQVYVLDWGIAKVRDEFRIASAEELSSRPGLTSAGAILGTLEYMPPEQARGETDAIDARADVYALGAILYEILAGRPPVLGVRETALLLKAQTGAVKPPRERKPSVPADLDAVCMMALAREPRDRYPSARALADDLRRWLEGDAVLARRPSAAARAWKQIVKRKALSISVAAAVVLLVSFVVYLVTHREDRALSEVKRSEDRIVGPLKKRVEELPDNSQGAERALQLIDAALAAEPRSWEAWLLKGKYHLKFLEHDAALEAFTRAAQINPSLATAHFQRGKILMDVKKDVAEALKAFQAALAAEADNEYALVGQARLAMLRTEFKRTLDLCDQAEPKARHVADLYFLRGLVHSAPDSGVLHDITKAITAYSKALELEPRMAGAWNNRGAAKMEANDDNGALADYNRAIELDPKYANAYSNRSVPRRHKGDLKGAIEDATRAIELGVKTVGPVLHRAQARQAAGDFAGALEDYSKAIELEPRNSATIANRGTVRRSLGDLDGSIADATRALEIDPKLVPAWSNRGNAKREKGDLAGAFQDYARALELDPGNVDALTNRSVAHAAKGDLAAALADANRALEKQPNSAVAVHTRGDAYRKQGNRAAAIADYTRAIELNPKQPLSYHYRAIVKRELGDDDGALPDLDRVIELGTAAAVLAESYRARANVHRKRQDWDRALADFAKSVELAPGVVGGWADRGLLYLNREDWERAEADLTKAVEIDPRQARLWNNRGSAREKRENFEGALADYAKALDVDPLYLKALVNRGRMRQKRGDVDGARADLTQAVRRLPADSPDREEAEAVLKLLPR